MLLRKRSKTKIKKLIREWNISYKEQNLDIKKMIQRWNSWKGHANHACTYHLKTKYLNKISAQEYLDI